MSLSKKAIGRRFGLLAAFVAALLIACTGVVLAQSSSSSTANAGYFGNTTVTPSEATQAGAAEPVSNVSSATGDVSAEARVPNGGFETGNFSEWLRANQRPLGDDGNWFVYSGTTSPLGGFAIAAPPQGDFAATTDQGGPGTHVLYRDIHLKRNMNHELSFYLYYFNNANRFFTPNTLSANLDRNNQQYRVDVLKPTANPFSVNDKAILKKLIQTDVGDPNTKAPTLRTFNLTAFAGKTVRLRFAEVDNQAEFLASVDKVRVASTSR
jgi:hypothetical protein